MPADSNGPAECIFRELLTEALTKGRRPPFTPLLGPASWGAIDVLAREHPDATADHVVAAHDAFAWEHGEESLGPSTIKATRNAALEYLAAQLAIIFPDVDPQSLAAVVQRIHADFESRVLPEIVPLLIEQAMHGLPPGDSSG
ncbi:MAG: hypothetical protein WCE30_17720 [Mycobacterium sp.]